MTAVVIGASSGLGRALAGRLAEAGQALLLVASDARDLETLACDLRLRHEVDVRTLALDLAHEADPGVRVLAALDGLPAPTALLLPIGYSRSDDDLSLDAAAIGRLLAINLHAPLAIVHALLPALLASRGTVVAFGSVAATRGRGRNVVYAAAKRGLESLCESLCQRHAPAQLRVQFYRLGFMRSNLTHGLRLPLPAAEPDAIAVEVVARLGRGSFFCYRPRWWWPITSVIRHLPWFAYRRMKD